MHKVTEAQIDNLAGSPGSHVSIGQAFLVRLSKAKLAKTLMETGGKERRERRWPWRNH